MAPKSTWLVLLGLLALASAAFSPAALAQDDSTQDDSTAASGEDAAQEGEATPSSGVEEVIIVTASRTEQSLHQVPSAFSVITSKDIENAAADDYGDLLRNVPGLNVSQMSARDIQISSRQATSSLANDQLVLLDGRTLYLDFFGFVMWDFLPVNTREIKQIEVVRGPGSAVWGANALSGVINLITKSPREIAGTSLVAGGGELGTLYGSLTHAGAGESVGYKVSLGYYEQDPYDRPTGFIPGTNRLYPSYENSGTEQPKVDLRLDWSQTPDTNWTFSSGWAATDGIMHSGIGPFDIDKSSYLSYFKSGWQHGAMNATFFVNDLDGDASNLLTAGVDGQPIELAFQSRTYNLDFTHSVAFGKKNFVTYGLNARHNTFDLSIAPGGDNRDEYGVFVQDEILFGDKVRWLIGGRFDDADPVGSHFSPRTSLMISPTYDHTFRISYNESYRAPSLINNHLDIAILLPLPAPIPVDPRLIAAAIAPGVPCQFVLNTCTPFLYTAIPTDATGNPDLEAVELKSYEIGYVATLADGRANLSIAAYRSRLEGDLDFFQPASIITYSPSNPPANWPVTLLNGVPVFPLVAQVPTFSYRNIGQKDDQGVEIAFSWRPNDAWSFSTNYTWQDEPEVEGISLAEVNLPPENRFNVSLGYDGGGFFVNGNVNYVDEAVWTDVLDIRGPTDSFTQLNLGVGFRFLDDKLVLAINGSNVTDERVQQHVFGDIISRKVTGEIRFQF